MIPRNREPTPPGEILEEEFLHPLGWTQTKLAERMGLSHVQQVNLIVNGRRAITAPTALLLARAFDTTPEFWMNLQVAHDLWLAQQQTKRKRKSA
jgi:addiction module HigA family antidote